MDKFEKRKNKKMGNFNIRCEKRKKNNQKQIFIIYTRKRGKGCNSKKIFISDKIENDDKELKNKKNYI